MAIQREYPVGFTKIANNYHLGMTKITHPFLVMGMLIMILDIFVWI